MMQVRLWTHPGGRDFREVLGPDFYEIQARNDRGEWKDETATFAPYVFAGEPGPTPTEWADLPPEKFAKGYPEFDPNQQRDDSGRWSSEGGGADAASKKLFRHWDETIDRFGDKAGKKMAARIEQDTPFTDEQVNAMREEFIKRFSESDREYMLYIIKKSGGTVEEYYQAVIVTDGDEASVGYADENLSKRLLYSLHNHPSGKSFSMADVEVTMMYDIDKMEVVGKDWIYTLEEPEGTWLPILSEEMGYGMPKWKIDFQSHIEWNRDDLEMMIDGITDESEQDRAREAAELDLHHHSWDGWAEDWNVDYERSRR